MKRQGDQINSLQEQVNSLITITNSNKEQIETLLEENKRQYANKRSLELRIDALEHDLKAKENPCPLKLGETTSFGTVISKVFCEDVNEEGTDIYWYVNFVDPETEETKGIKYAPVKKK